MSYRQTIEYLFGLQKHGIKFGLTNSYALMELMGDPHTKFRAVHIAGTNGKGSTAAFLAGMLRAAGHRVGLYTSPHLVSFTERIRINGAQISEGRVVELAERIRKGCRLLGSGEGPGPFSPTFFEVTTALAFTYFAEEGVDLAVVETGMGGRLDSTNVVTPLVSVITNIDLEHTEFLGNSLEEIAREKAGIIKRGIPVVTGASRAEAVGVIEGTAAGLSAPLYRLGRDFRAEHIAPGPPQSSTWKRAPR
jgi:dihydrofolate synthase/folylpolyglutamate synthase